MYFYDSESYMSRHVVYEYDKCTIAVLPFHGYSCTGVHEQSTTTPCDHLSSTIHGTGTDFPREPQPDISSAWAANVLSILWPGCLSVHD